MRKLLRIDAKKRLTAAQALKHPWVKGTAKSNHMEEAQAQLKQFNARRKMRVSSYGCRPLNIERHIPTIKRRYIKRRFWI